MRKKIMDYRTRKKLDVAIRKVATIESRTDDLFVRHQLEAIKNELMGIELEVINNAKEPAYEPRRRPGANEIQSQQQSIGQGDQGNDRQPD
jgi:hypothetical protein